MKKILLYILAAVTLGTGCRKTYNDTIQGQTPDERIAAAMTAYQKKLTSSPYGWIMVEKTTGLAFNGGVSQTGPAITLIYYMQFSDNNQVNMLSDFDTSMISTLKSSGYSVKALTRPALIFDTYSYLHVPCDPDPNISKSPFGTGYGWGTDFEFSFADSTAAASLGDTIQLKGNLNGASASLIKATQAQRDAYLTGSAGARLKGFIGANNILEYFKRLTLGGVVYDIKLDANNRQITFTWFDASGVAHSASTGYYATTTSIVFLTPIVNGSQKFSGIDEATFNTGNSTVSLTIGGQQTTLAGVTTPIKTDLTAPKRWWQYGYDNGYFWASGNGFHSNGLDDAFGIRANIDPSGVFYYYIYWPGYNTAYDAFIPVTLSGNSIGLNSNGTAAKIPSTYTADGRIIFTRLGNFGTIVPNSPVAKSNTALYNASGYYLVQTGPLSYDMVGAADARTWISWFWPL